MKKLGLKQIELIPRIKELCIFGLYEDALELCDRIENQEISIKERLLCAEHEEGRSKKCEKIIDLQQAINIYIKEIYDLEQKISICARCEPMDMENLKILIGQHSHKVAFLGELEEVKTLIEIRS